MAPEFVMEGVFSVKSDVFGFGVLLLEILSGQRNGIGYLEEHQQSLIQDVRTFYTSTELFCQNASSRKLFTSAGVDSVG
jgi:hypothetical protein